MTVGDDLGPTCSDLCLEMLIKEFTKKPNILANLRDTDKAAIYASLSEEIPLKQCIELVQVFYVKINN